MPMIADEAPEGEAEVVTARPSQGHRTVFDWAKAKGHATGRLAWVLPGVIALKRARNEWPAVSPEFDPHYVSEAEYDEAAEEVQHG